MTFLILEKDNGFGDNRQKLDEILSQRTIEQARLTLDEFKNMNDGTELAEEIDDQLDDELERAYLDLSKLK